MCVCVCVCSSHNWDETVSIWDAPVSRGTFCTIKKKKEEERNLFGACDLGLKLNLRVKVGIASLFDDFLGFF